MELELAADADAAALIVRLKPLVASRDGRPRSHAIKIVWHDSPEHALLADGLTLAEQGGARRLERVNPGVETWLPAQPPPVLSDAPDPAELPSPLAPLAAFEGRRSVSVHHLAESAVTLTIDRGTLRAVTAERLAARIGLSGEEQAVRAAATLIAGAVPAAVPGFSLAAEAIAMATGAAPQPRHLGAPVLPEAARTVPEALAHILGHLTDVVLAHAPRVLAPRGGGEDGGVHNAIHQMRVAVRRARSAVSIFRPALAAGALDAVNDGLKTLGGRLGPARDWDVFADETVPEIQEAIPGDERLVRLAAAASRQRTMHRKQLAAYLASPAFRQLGIDLAWFTAAQGWRAAPPAEAAPAADAASEPLAEPLADPSADPSAEPLAEVSGEPRTEPMSLEQFADTVLQQRWKKLVSTGKRIEELDIPALHGVRLRAKRVRYAAEMFATLHDGKAAKRFIERLSDLQERLGVLNDGAVASHLLLELGGPGGRHGYACGLITGFMAARARRIRPRIVKTFQRFRRQHAYWT
nr:CHAD domain-containing protein [uncultured Rhodopila sp.]